MKKAFCLFLSLIICFGIVFASPVGSSQKALAAGLEIKLPDNLKDRFDKFVNIMIDVVHRAITAVRYPWKPKTDNTVDMSKFTLTFADEFDGNAVNSKIWWNYHPGIRKGGYWEDGQSFIRDGNLVIRAEYKPDGKFGEGYYCNRVDTRRRFEQTYGYFECRCILPAAQGLWSAFWLSSENIGNGIPGERGTEIDVFESPLWYRGNSGLENNLISSNLHYGGYELGHRYTNVTVTRAVNPYTEYNTYGVEWNENEYIFYVNGVETGRSRFGGVSKVPEYMLLSVEIDGVGGKPYHGWSGIITDNEEGALPAELVVDYVRAYQYSDLLQQQQP